MLFFLTIFVSLFLEEGRSLNPETVMLTAVAKPDYDQLLVYDSLNY